MPHATPSLLVSACLLAVLTGQDRLQQYVGQAVAELAQPEASADACRKLENLGPRIVPFVRGLLHWSKKGDTSTAQREQLIYVLGRFGEAALPALPELRDILRDHDETPAMQAVWTLGNLAPYLTSELADAVRADLDHACRAARDCAQAGRLTGLLQLGPHPDWRLLENHLSRAGPSRVAACAWLCMHADQPFDGRDELTTIVRQHLDDSVRGAPVAFDKGARDGTDDLAMAVLALTDGLLDAATARGLLQHWQAEQRLRAVLWLQDHGATLPVPARSDLVVRLWDADPTVARCAAEALAAWGPAGLVGLAPMRHLAAQHTRTDLRQAFTRAADTVMAECAKLPAADAALLQAVDDVLGGRTTSTLLAPPSPTGLSLAATTLRMAEWNDPNVLGALLALFEAAGEDDDAIDAVYGWLATTDPRTADLALVWLAQRGAAVRHSVGRRTGRPMHDECMWLARFGVPEASRAAAIEATAWFELSGATAEESDAALRSTNTRLSARALAAWLAAPGAWHPDRDELRRLATLPETEPLRLQQAMPFGLHDRPTEFRCLLSEPVRTLAALALAATDVPLPQPAELAPLLQRYCGTTPDGLAAFVRERRQAGTLVAVLDTIEADCRARLGLGAELRWPSAGARR